MGGFTIKVEGLAALKERMNELAGPVLKRMTDKALRAGANVYQKEEEDRAPERPNLPSGTAIPVGALKRDVTIMKVPGQPVILIKPGKLTNQAAHLVEYGHRQVTGGKSRLDGKTGQYKGSGAETGFVPPHPYARPAFEAAAQGVLDAVAASLREDIQKLDKKGGK